MTTTTTPSIPPAPTITTLSPLFTALVGMQALVVLLQGVFAGVFLRVDGERDASASWIDAHAWGAHIGTVVAIVTAGYALAKLRDRRPLVVASVALAVVFLLESYLGGLIRDDGKDDLTAVHVPLGMAIMGLTVWLSVTATRLRRAG